MQITIDGRVFLSPTAAQLENFGFEKEAIEKALLKTQVKQKELEIKSLFIKQCEPAFERYSHYEIAAFSVLSREADAYLSAHDAPTPMINAVLAETGQDKASYVASIDAHRQQMCAVVGAAIGRRKLATDAVNDAQTIADLASINSSTFFME